MPGVAVVRSLDDATDLTGGTANVASKAVAEYTAAAAAGGDDGFDTDDVVVAASSLSSYWC